MLRRMLFRGANIVRANQSQAPVRQISTTSSTDFSKPLKGAKEFVQGKDREERYVDDTVEKLDQQFGWGFFKRRGDLPRLAEIRAQANAKTLLDINTPMRSDQGKLEVLKLRCKTPGCKEQSIELVLDPSNVDPGFGNVDLIQHIVGENSEFNLAANVKFAKAVGALVNPELEAEIVSEIHYYFTYSEALKVAMLLNKHCLDDADPDEFQTGLLDALTAELGVSVHGNVRFVDENFKPIVPTPENLNKLYVRFKIIVSSHSAIQVIFTDKQGKKVSLGVEAGRPNSIAVGDPTGDLKLYDSGHQQWFTRTAYKNQAHENNDGVFQKRIDEVNKLKRTIVAEMKKQGLDPVNKEAAEYTKQFANGMLKMSEEISQTLTHSDHSAEDFTVFGDVIKPGVIQKTSDGFPLLQMRIKTNKAFEVATFMAFLCGPTEISSLLGGAYNAHNSEAGQENNCFQTMFDLVRIAGKEREFFSNFINQDDEFMYDYSENARASFVEQPLQDMISEAVKADPKNKAVCVVPSLVSASLFLQLFPLTMKVYSRMMAMVEEAKKLADPEDQQKFLWRNEETLRRLENMGQLAAALYVQIGEQFGPNIFVGKQLLLSERHSHTAVKAYIDKCKKASTKIKQEEIDKIKHYAPVLGDHSQKGMVKHIVAALEAHQKTLAIKVDGKIEMSEIETPKHLRFLSENSISRVSSAIELLEESGDEESIE
jgi:hypothetical protein